MIVVRACGSLRVRSASCTAALVLACALLAPASARGQGFAINEQGACTMSRGGAGVAEPCGDGSAIFVNPAGIAGRSGILIGGGDTLIFPSGTFTGDSGRSSKLERTVEAPPHAYFAYGLPNGLALGVGLYVPYGLGVQWPLDFGGRFVSYDVDLRSIYVQPTIGYAINDRVSVGGGPTIVTSRVELNRREDLARVPLGPLPGLTFGALVDRETDFVNTTLSATGDTAVGANVGVAVTLHDRVRAGVRYLTRVKIDYDGDAEFSPAGGPFAVRRPNPLGLPIGTPLDMFVSQAAAVLRNQSVSTELEMPAQLVAGVSVHASPDLTLFADYQWIDWSAFESVALDFAGPVPPDERLVQNYRDTSGLRIGADFQLRPALRLSAGYIYNQAAAPDETVTPLLPEATRNHLTAGVGWSLRPDLTLDVAYQFLRQSDRRGRIVNPPPGELPTTALNSGVYRNRADLLGITLSYRR